MKRTHFAHRLIVALVLSAVLLSYVLGSTFLMLGALTVLLVTEWHGIARFLHIGQLSLARVEQSNIRIPKKWELVSTNLLTVLFLVLSVQFVSQVYAMTYTLFITTSEVKNTPIVVSADFNNDGYIDYVAGNQDSTDAAKLDLYLNDGAGSYTHTLIGVSKSFQNLAVGDIDGDGDNDIIAMNANGSNNLVKMVNNGTGVFTSYTISSSLVFNTAHLFLVDVNNDGSLDILFGTNAAVYKKSVWTNDGHGVFTEQNSTTPQADGMTVGDFNGDGYIDIASMSRTTGNTVRINSGTGAFSTWGTITSSSFVQSLTSGDLDGDGDIDLLAINDSSGSAKPILNPGTAGAFTNGTAFGGFNSNTSASLADLDNDGDLDAILGGAPSGLFNGGTKIWLNNGSAVFTQSGTAQDVADCSQSIAINDLDGDGDLDYVSGTINCGLQGDQADHIYKSDQAATSANTAPTAPSTDFSATTLSQNNRIISVDITNDVGQFPSIGIDSDDIPTIAYYDTTAGDLKVLRCDNTPCVSVNSSAVDSTGDVGKYSNAVMPSDDLLFVAYYDVTNADLKTLKCGNAACTSGNTITTVDTSGGVYPSVAIGSDGFPIISYTTSAGVRVAKCGNAACSSGNTVSTAVADGIFSYSSIAIPSDGLPVISYLDTSGGIDFAILKMAKCGDTSCSSGNSTVTVDSFGYVSSVVIGSDDLPIIAYLGTSSALKIAHCGNSACSSGNTTTTLDSTLGTWGEGFGSPAARLLMTKPSDGLPIISYWDGTSDDLKIIKCGNASCSSGNTTSRPDSSGSVGKTSSIQVTDDDRAVVAYYDGTFGDLKVLRCGNVACSSGGSNGQSLVVRLDWGSGSDTQTATRLLQYQPMMGTGSSTNNILSSKTASPRYVTRLMPNGQSRTLLFKISSCAALTYYWSVATVDTGFKSARSDEYSFTVDSACVVTDNGSTGGGGTSGGTTGGGGTSTTGGGTLWNIDRSGGGGATDVIRLIVSAISDVNANAKRDSREQLLSLKGVSVTASGTSLAGLPIRKTVLLSGTGIGVFDLPPSGPKGYTVLFDSGALLKLGYIPTGALTQTGILLSSVTQKGASSTVNLTLAFRRSDLLRYAPCLTVGLQTSSEKPGTDAEMLLQRLRDPFNQGVLRGVTLSGSLMNRGDFFTLLQRTQCVPLMTDRAALLQKLKSFIVVLGARLSLVDLPLGPGSDSLVTYSLIAGGSDVTRQTTIGPAADLNSPVTRRDAIRALASLLQLPKLSREDIADELLPADLKKGDELVEDYVSLKRLGVFPESFATTPGMYQGLTPSEAAVLLARAAFRNGKISLLPDIEDVRLQKVTKKAAPVPTFLADLPPLKAMTCFERTQARSTDIAFVDLLPGDTKHADIRELVMRSTKNDADQTLWLIPATRRPTEFGIVRGQAKLSLEEPVSLLETVRALLVMSCLPPDTRLQAMLGLSSKEVIQGSAETRVSRDRLSDLPRDPSFASRVLYRAQDHQKEFDLSLLSYASNIERQETRSPASGLNVREGSDLLASALLMILVKQHSLTPQKADLIASSVSAAISRDLLGKEFNWRDEGLLVRTPLTRDMFFKYLATVVFNRTIAPTASKVSSSFSLGEIWWERLK